MQNEKRHQLIEEHIEHLECLEQARVKLLALQQLEMSSSISNTATGNISQRTDRLLHLNSLVAQLVRESLHLIRKEDWRNEESLSSDPSVQIALS